MRRLEGKRIALTGPRKAEELSVIAQKLGGIPLLRPAQGTVAVDQEQVQAKLKKLISEGADWVILTTSVGTEILYKAAIEMEQGDEFLACLRKTKLAARGYKTFRYLKTLDLEAAVKSEDGTTDGILREMQGTDMAGQRVALQLYGDHAPRLVQWLKEQGAEYEEILPYEHIAPDLDVMNTLLTEIIHGDIDAVTFTSTPQVRFMMAYAREHGLAGKLLEAFGKQTVAVAVGKVTAEALRDEGIVRVVAPQEERMGSMMVALAQYYEAESINAK